MSRVLIAMSGGVDSAVAAARLVDEGFDVVGVTLHLWDYPDGGSDKSRCCAPEDQHDARRVADFLNIPHYAFDRRELFKAQVVDPFVDDYAKGLTPSPCVSCNRTVKMRELFPLAKRLGAERIATGHYARLATRDGRARLLRGVDAVKDQSYFLHMLTHEELSRALFPLGASTKPEVRQEAIERGLPGANKGESQELCFIHKGGYAAFVRERAGDRVRPGPILGPDGSVVGQHEGVVGFTVGQRKGLGVALGEAAFVTNIDPDTGAVKLGREEDLLQKYALVDDCVWADGVTFPLRAEVKIRSRQAPVAATLTLRGAGSREVMVEFDSPARAVSPGQIAVAYCGDEVLGGGRIVRAEAQARAAGAVASPAVT